jgi:tRNA pseudouridine55 synthase
VTGLLPLDKPEGPTSHDLVARTRRALGTRRVGHAGTLDPFASGLLLLAVGSATRLVEYLHHLDKTYEAEALLGVTTNSDDRDGAVIARSEGWKAHSEAEVEAALAAQVGTFLQHPPQYSAKKVGGEAAHRRIRRGETLELAPAQVTVHAVELLECALPRVRFRVRCGTGTYIRAMARDLGRALGCGGHLVALRRTRIGPFAVEDALPAEGLSEEGKARAHLLDPAAAVAHLPEVEVSADEEIRLRMGQAIRRPLEEWPGGRAPQSGVPLALHHGGVLVGVGSFADGLLRPRKVLPVTEDGA